MKKILKSDKIAVIIAVVALVISVINTVLIININSKLSGIDTWTYRMVPLVYNSADATVKSVDCQDGDKNSCSQLKSAAENLRNQLKIR